MPRTFAQQPSLCALLSAILLGVFTTSSEASPQGYLSDEAPAPKSLDELETVLDDIGLKPDPHRPGWLIPGILDRIRITEEWLPESSLFVSSRSYYRYRDEGDGQIREAFATGGRIDFDSGWLFDTFKIGLVGYTSQKTARRRRSRWHGAFAKGARWLHRTRAGLPAGALPKRHSPPVSARAESAVHQPQRHPHDPENLRGLSGGC